MMVNFVRMYNRRSNSSGRAEPPQFLYKNIIFGRTTLCPIVSGRRLDAHSLHFLLDGFREGVPNGNDAFQPDIKRHALTVTAI